MDLPSDEDGLIDYVLTGFTSERDRLQSLLDNQYTSGNYPDKAVVENGVKLCNDLLTQKKDNTALLKKLISMEDEFLDLNEDTADVLSFFKNQKKIFDGAVSLLNSLSQEKEYLQAEQEATKALAQISSVLNMPKPYKRIVDLPNYIQQVQTVYGQLMDLKRQDVISEVQAAMGEIHQTAKSDQKDIVAKADSALATKKNAVYDASSLTQLDAMKIQIANIRQQYLKALVVIETPHIDTVTMNRSSLCYTAKLETEADIDRYVEDIKEKLKNSLNGHDVLHII